MIDHLDLARIICREPEEMARLKTAVSEVGFLTISNTVLDEARLTQVLDAYRNFFLQPYALKSQVDMARTGSNRGWGAPHSEQVDPMANPDYKEVFDCGTELGAEHPGVPME